MTDQRSTKADREACSRLLRQGSKSFYLASRVLPARVREPASALYAFCRLADDAVDLGGSGQRAIEALIASLDRVYAGEPANDPVERALAHVVAVFAIPRPLLDGLIEGLAWDNDGRGYQDLADLQAYGARVASTVGVITTLIMGVRTPGVLARAADLGVAMQLTNIARDVGEDARAGRLYLPQRWMRDAGLCPDAWRRHPVFDARLAHVIERLLHHADDLYRRATPGIAHLPRDCRTGIHAARLIYAEIGHEVAERRYDSIGSRAVVSKARKLQLLTAAFRESLINRHDRPKDEIDRPPLPEARFLVEAVRLHPIRPIGQPAGHPVGRGSISQRVIRTIELFTRLEVEERMQRGRH